MVLHRAEHLLLIELIQLQSASGRSGILGSQRRPWLGNGLQAMIDADQSKLHSVDKLAGRLAVPVPDSALEVVSRLGLEAGQFVGKRST